MKPNTRILLNNRPHPPAALPKPRTSARSLMPWRWGSGAPSLALLALAAICVWIPPQAQAAPKVTTRPLHDWLVAQTGQFGWYEPNVSPRPFIFVDYANRWGSVLGLDTTVEGSVTERVLPDGQTLVSVQVHITDALCYGLEGSQLVFGYTVGQLFFNRSLHAALADGHFKLDFLSDLPPGSPLPSFPSIPNSKLVKVLITAEATGTFRAASGYPDGTPATAQVTQVGLYSVPSKGDGAPGTNNDYYPAEHIHFEPIAE